MCTPSIKRILIAVDASESSEFATVTAGHLAAELGASVALLHVVCPMMAYGLDMIALAPEAMETAMDRGRVLLRERREDLPPHLSVTENLEEGVPEDRIVECAAAWQADLVVIGDHNRGRLSSFLLGSTAEQIVRRSPCPVLVARPKTPPSNVAGRHDETMVTAELAAR